MIGPKCCHCQKSPVSRPRGLCWGCYYRPGVREMYPSTSKFARRGVGNLTGVRPLPKRPTGAAPGSAAKRAVLAKRAERGEALWHPGDRLDPAVEPAADLDLDGDEYTPLVIDVLEDHNRQR